jgi:hypothetical protein
MAGKKITELNSGSLSNLPLSGVTTVVYSGVTYQHNLTHLRQILVDSGSHYFTGSQVINGNLTISGSITAQQYILSSSITNIVTETVSGSSNFGNSLDDRHIFTGSVFVTGSVNVSGSGNFKNLIVGTGSFHTDNPEVLHVENSGSYNIVHFQANNEYYAQINVKNTNSGSNSSTDIVVTADNGTEGNHFVDLGINSSTYTGGLVGYENDAYLLNVGKDLYIGTVGGTSHPAELKLFAQNQWEDPQITIHTGSQITFNTSSFTEGYVYEFSGSVKLNNELSVSSIKNLSGDLHLTTNGDTVFVMGSNFSVPNGGISSGFSVTAPIISGSSLTGSLDWINLINVPSLISGSSQINYSGLTGIPNGIISGSEQLPSGLVSGSSQISYTGITDVPSNIVSGSSQITNLGFATTSSLLQITGSDNQIRIVNTSGTSSIQLPSGVLAHSGSLHIGSSGGLQFGSMLLGQSVTGFISTISDGNFRFGDSSGGSNMGRIILGSVNTDYPSIKREGAGISIKTADDSTYSFISSSKFVTSGGTSSQFVKGDGSLDSSNIISGSSQITNLGFAITGSNTFIGDQTINGSLIIEGVSEVISVDGGFGGNRDFDYTSGSIFYLTGLTGNGTWNINNVPTTNNRGLTMTFIIEQGGTPYSGSVYSLNSTPVTVKWADSTIPTGSANKTEVIGLTAFRVGSSWSVLGSLSTFGS